MKKSRLLGAVCACISPFIFCHTSQAATLVGDDVTVRTLVGSNPNIHTYMVTVAAGSGDELVLPSHGKHNIDAASIYVDWDIPGFGSVGFDSTRTDIEYLDLDWTDAPGILTGFTLTTNINGLGDLDGLGESRINFGDDFITVNLAGLTAFGGQLFSFYQLDLQVSQVPLPPAVMLFLAGLAGLAGVARRKTPA